MAGIAGDLNSLYKSATSTNRADAFNGRGFTPFQFSSRMTQVNTSQLGGLIPQNIVSNLVNERYAWYEMWVNPLKIEISRDFLHKKENTAGSVVTFHYRPDVYKMKVSGVCGWIAINPQKDKDTRSLGFGSIADIKKSGTLWSANKVRLDPASRNSPRIFLERLRNIAEESMYFVDLNGIEHYNIKYIKIFTKQYPDGVVCEGYYTNFVVPEEGEDVQTVNYSFDFTVEKMTSVNALRSMLGMFGTSSANARKTLSPLPGVM
jgi:hypothetical protein